MVLKINGKSYNIKSCVWCPFFHYNLDASGYAIYVCKLNTFLNKTTNKGKIMTKLLNNFIWNKCPLKDEGDLQSNK